MPVFDHTRCETVLSSIKWYLLYFNFFPLHRVLSLGVTEKNLAPLLLPSLHIFLHIDRIPPEISHLQADQSQFSQPLLICQILQALPGFFLDSLQYAHVS